MRTNFIFTDDPLSGERIYEYTHSSGAKALAVKTETSAPSAAVSVPFSGGTSDISLEGFRYIPTFPGSAHFAEHMIFTGGRLDRFCAMGADANAETSMTGTTYYVTGGNEFIHAFGDLIGMVARPRFGEDELEKERDIILREKSDDDDVFTKGRNALTDLIFSKGSVRREIIGDKKSIKKMNSSLLRGIYRYAYRPSVTSLAAVSDVDFERIFDVVDASFLGMQPEAPPSFGIIKSERRDTRGAVKQVRSLKKSGFLFVGLAPDLSPLSHDYAKKQVYSSMLESMIFDRTEYIGYSLLEKGRGFNGGFRSDAEIFGDDLILTAGLSCEDRKGAAELFVSVFDSAKSMGAKNIFPHTEAKRRSLIADYISVFDSPSDLALTLSEYAARGARFTDVGRTLLEFDENDFLSFADKVLSSAAVYAVYGD